jgi:hypothetical protein
MPNKQVISVKGRKFCSMNAIKIMDKSGKYQAIRDKIITCQP